MPKTRVTIDDLADQIVSEHYFTAETALLLRAAFLPGQQRQARDERSAAFARGFLHALTQLGAA